EIMMIICSGSRAETEETITRVKSLVQLQNGNLQIEQNGELVEYTATMNEFDIEWEAGTAYVTLTCIASTPIASTVQPTNIASTNITSSSTTVGLSIDGSYLAEPQITVTINTVTGGTAKELSIINAGTNAGLT